jgi:hypothetical protein
MSSPRPSHLARQPNASLDFANRDRQVGLRRDQSGRGARDLRRGRTVACGRSLAAHYTVRNAFVSCAPVRMSALESR